jgi:hypothetical protein
VRPALTIAPPACASADRRTGAAPRLEDEGRPVRSQVDVASRVDVLVGLKRRAVGQLNLGKSTSEFVRSGWLEWLLGQRSIRAISSSLAVEGVKDLPVPHDGLWLNSLSMSARAGVQGLDDGGQISPADRRP